MKKHLSNRIIFLLQSTFNKRDYDRFSVKYFLDKGFKVEIWDLTPYINPYWYINHKVTDPVFYNCYSIFKNKTQISNALLKISSEDILFSIISLNSNTSFIFDYFTNNNIKYGLIKCDSIPILSKPKDKRNYLNYLKSPFKLFQILLNKSKNIFFKKYFPSFVIIGSISSLNNFKKTKFYHNQIDIIEAHSFDYDVFLKNNKKNNNKEIKHAVMLDEGGPYHPNIKKDGQEVKKNTYYNDLNSFFKKFEKIINYDIVIAAHPRINYSEIGNLFDSRLIKYNQTLELVKNSSYVLAHASTSINYAVLFRKPIVFINSYDYSFNYQNSIKYCAETLGYIPTNINSSKIEFSSKIDKDKYNFFIDNYIKYPGSSEKKIFEIFIDFLGTKYLSNND